MEMENLNKYSNEFKKYLIENCKSNLRFISKIRFNKKSISVTVNDYKSLIFNNFFTEKYLYNLIISYLIDFIKENEINYSINRDYLNYKFENIRIKEKII